MFPHFLAIPFLCGCTSSASFPKPLSKEEEAACLSLFQTGTEEEREAAKQRLILHNLRLVAYIAKKYHAVRTDTEELLSIGIVGLIKAILSYDPQKSIRLATYASRCIENEILMHLRASRKFQNDISLHEPIGTDRDGNEIVMLDVINSDTPDFAEQVYFSEQSKKMLLAVREALTKREQIVICLRYGIGNREAQTQQEIAQQLGISRSYIFRHAYCKRWVLRNRFQFSEAEFDNDLFIFSQFDAFDQTDE